MLSPIALAKNKAIPKASPRPKGPLHDSVIAGMADTFSPNFAYSLAGVRLFSQGEQDMDHGTWRTTAPSSKAVQAKLEIRSVNDPLEQEADRVADTVTRMPESGTPNAAPRPQKQHATMQMKTAGPAIAGGVQAPAVVHNVLRSPGRPLDASTRAFMEPRFGYDFSRVRVHTDATAAESAKAVQARAYTVGNHLVFGPGQFTPATRAGQRLLGHELAHVVQQQFHPALQRQGAGQPTPGFSVNQAAYQQLVTQAIQSISGNLVQANTLAPVIQPVLSSLVSHVIWRDQKGKESGGGEVSVPLPGTPKVVLKLRMVLDDQLDPKVAGEFEHKEADKTHGTISVMIRKADDSGSLKNILFHETAHMLVWAMQNWGAARFSNQDRPSIRALNLSLHSREIAGIRTQLDALATSVNSRRRAAKQSEITAKDLDGLAPWLLDEAEVRAETKVFELYSDTQTFLAKRGPKIFVDTSKIIGIDSAMIDFYLFERSRKFLPSDRAGLTAADKQVLDILRDMLAGIADLQVKRQFSITPYTIGTGIPPADVSIPLSPLPQPQFRPLPLP